MVAALLEWKKSGEYYSAIVKQKGIPARAYSIHDRGGIWSTFTTGSNTRTLGWSPTLELAKKNCANIEKYYRETSVAAS
jgi:hypothetical protein